VRKTCNTEKIVTVSVFAVIPTLSGPQGGLTVLFTFTIRFALEFAVDKASIMSWPYQVFPLLKSLIFFATAT
jgi:hypothetical protein